MILGIDNKLRKVCGIFCVLLHLILSGQILKKFNFGRTAKVWLKTVNKDNLPSSIFSLKKHSSRIVYPVLPFLKVGTKLNFLKC